MKTTNLYRVAIAARQAGVNRTTLKSAIERGELKAETTGCGLPLVSLDDVRRWASLERKPGRKPGQNSS